MKSIEEATKTAVQRVEMYRSAAALIPAAVKVIDQFDGKVYNCRFDKALAAAVPRLRAEKRYNTLAIYTYPEHNYSRAFTLADVKFEDMPDGKRISADKLRESARAHRENLLRTAYEIETSIETMPQTMAYYQETVDKMNDFLKRIPSEIRDMYGLPYCIRTW